MHHAPTRRFGLPVLLKWRQLLRKPAPQRSASPPSPPPAHGCRFGLSVLFILAVVAAENFCTWATSASDRRKYDYVPLQDNAETGLLWLFQVGCCGAMWGRVGARVRGCAGGWVGAHEGKNGCFW